MTTQSIKIALIQTNGGTQSRAALRDDVVEEYAEGFRNGDEFPPVVVFYDGENYILADGFHRIGGAKMARLKTINADVRQGTRREAILYSVGANGKHGLRRTNEDKRRAVETLLNDSEWSRWTDREIARQCSVDHKTVSRMRETVTGEIPSQTRTYRTRHGTTAAMNTAAINHGRERPATQTNAPQVRDESAPATTPVEQPAPPSITNDLGRPAGQDENFRAHLFADRARDGGNAAAYLIELCEEMRDAAIFKDLAALVTRVREEWGKLEAKMASMLETMETAQ